jgi:hypothetical protein
MTRIRRKRPPGGPTAAERRRLRRYSSAVYLSNNYDLQHARRFPEHNGYPAFFDLTVGEYLDHQEIRPPHHCYVATRVENDLIAVSEHRLVELVRRQHPENQNETVVVFYGTEICSHPPMTQHDASLQFRTFFTKNGDFKRKSVHWRG